MKNWGGCRLNEEMIETLFVVNTPNPKSKETTPRSAFPSPNPDNRVLDPKKSQNIAISLRALNVTLEEVCDALYEGIFFSHLILMLISCSSMSYENMVDLFGWCDFSCANVMI